MVPLSSPLTATETPSTSPAATAWTLSLWPRSGSPRAAPVRRFHTRTVPSRPPLTATGVPSTSPAATAWTLSCVAKQRIAAGRAGPQVPHPQRAIRIAADRYRDAVHLTDRHRIDLGGLATLHSPAGRAGPQVPHPYRAIKSSRR